MTQQQSVEYERKSTEELKELLTGDFEDTNEPPLTVEEILQILDILVQKNHGHCDAEASWQQFQKLYLDEE